MHFPPLDVSMKLLMFYNEYLQLLMNEMLNRKGSGEILHSISEAVISIVNDSDDAGGKNESSFPSHHI